MKYYELDKDEEQLLEGVEQGEFQPSSAASKAALTAAAKLAGTKTRNINIRVSERTVRKLKVKAAEQGIPYQTLAASILHRNTD